VAGEQVRVALDRLRGGEELENRVGSERFADGLGSFDEKTPGIAPR